VNTPILLQSKDAATAAVGALRRNDEGMLIVGTFTFTFSFSFTSDTLTVTYSLAI
jgi:hypothetical protein